MIWRHIDGLPLRSVGLAVLVCCTTGCASRPSETQAADSDSRMTITTPAGASDHAGPPPFAPPPTGYRALGGVFFNGGGIVVVAPDMSHTLEKNDLSISLMHGMSVSAHVNDAAGFVPAVDCVAAGDDPAHPIEVAHLADPINQVQAGIACALLRHPGNRWVASQLIADDRHYLAMIALRDDSGHLARVFTGVTGFAEKFASELQ